MSSFFAFGSVTGSRYGRSFCLLSLHLVLSLEGSVIGQGRSLVCLFPSSGFGSVTGLRQRGSLVFLSSSSAFGSVIGFRQGRSLVLLSSSAAFASVTGLREGRSFCPLLLPLALSLEGRVIGQGRSLVLLSSSSAFGSVIGPGKVCPFVLFFCLWLCHWPQAR